MKTKARKIPKLIYNDDTCTLRNVPPPHTPESISLTLDYLKGTQVDCLCWCLGEQIAYSWPSQVMENFYDLKAKGAALATGWEESRNVMLTLHQQGIDYLPLLIDRAHAQGLTFMASFRMNDTHIKSYPNSVLAPEFWKAHQHYRLWEITDAKGYYNAALDYSYPEVRNRYRDAIAEVAKGYDVDGIELDFTRSPYFFQPSEAWDKRMILTQFVDEIRALLLEEDNRRGRPFTLVLRIPSQETTLRAAGIDARGWINQRLADILVVSELANNYNQNIEPWLSLCREAGVLLYPAVEAALSNTKCEFYSPLVRNPFVPRHDGAVPLTWEEVILTQRAAAQNLLAQKPDGLYMFNYACFLVEGQNPMHNDRPAFDRLTSLLSEACSLKTLANKEKSYTFYNELPIYVEAGRPRAFHQTVPFTVRGADLKAAQVALSFRQIAERNPHADGEFRQNSFVKTGVLKYYLNDMEIPLDRLIVTKAPAGRIRSGFTLKAHQQVEIAFSGRELLNGENKLSFEMPHFPRDADPYIYIYELDVHLTF